MPISSAPFQLPMRAMFRHLREFRATSCIARPFDVERSNPERVGFDDSRPVPRAAYDGRLRRDGPSRAAGTQCAARSFQFQVVFKGFVR
ncbi:hypothetical protein [Burkholderia pseudomallei]|uniref:hypothetical protein n=1 Tax=Burkholderia pseudomallei TaxID=28450 RepID=UPI0005729CA5|nr:hypothetical protein [Burkholderia pseudomallei]